MLDEVVHLLDYTVEEIKNGEVVVNTKKALKISIEYKISVYDAHFIALAYDFNTLLVTEDKEVLKKCPKLAISLHDFLNMK